jgi:hypothetical protein
VSCNLKGDICCYRTTSYYIDIFFNHNIFCKVISQGLENLYSHEHHIYVFFIFHSGCGTGSLSANSEANGKQHPFPSLQNVIPMSTLSETVLQ